VYEDLGLVSIHVLISWCSTKEIGVSSRFVPTQYLVELELSLGYRCLQVLLS
jgi:hypothetical protein